MVVRYLLQRPVAVFASFFTILAIGILSYLQLPETLLPSIDPPTLMVKVTAQGSSPQFIESNILKPLRVQLAGAFGLEDVGSVASNGSGQIRLAFAYGTDMKLAFVETNEKIDQSLGSLPADLLRPEVFPVNNTDIPVARLQITSNRRSLYELSEFVKYVLTKRIQAIEGVASVQISGQLEEVIKIIPDRQKTAALGISDQDIVSAIKAANFQDFQVAVKEGIYAFNITVSNPLQDEVSLERLPIGINGVALQRIASIEITTKMPENAHFFNEQRGLVVSVHRTSSSNLSALSKRLNEHLAVIQSEFKSINFEYSQEQNVFLNTSLSQLNTALLLGLFFSVFVLYFFTRNIRLAFVMMLVIPISMALTSIIFYLLGLSINIITLSGIILGLGLLIDNSIILIDTITDESKRLPIDEACISGTKAVFTPLLSSAFTTVSVFIPLLAIGGVSSIFFSKQALSLTAILLSSLLVTYTFTPVAYKFIVKKISIQSNMQFRLHRFYIKTHTALSGIKLAIVSLVIILLGVISAVFLDLEQFPEISTAEIAVNVLWNEPLTLDANVSRTLDLLTAIAPKPTKAELDIGLTSLDPTALSLLNKAVLYLKFESYAKRNTAEANIRSILAKHKGAKYTIKRAKNPFDQLFAEETPYIRAKIRTTEEQDLDISTIPDGYAKGLGFINQQAINLKVNEDRLSTKSIDYQRLFKNLQSGFAATNITTVKRTSSSINILLDNPQIQNLNDILERPVVLSDSTKDQYRMKDFISVNYHATKQFITADLAGTYKDIEYDQLVNDDLINQLQNWGTDHKLIIDLSGAYFDTSEQLFTLIGAILGAILLLYVILAAQFESLKQPFIILLTVPLTICGGLFGLYCSGNTLNISSLIGMIIMLGIMVNDSILKIDTINTNLKKGFQLHDAIEKAGLLRLKPIIMTSLTTILALSPTLWSYGLGAEIQKPLAVVVISGLVFGTLISIYIVPVLYRLFHKDLPLQALFSD